MISKFGHKSQTHHHTSLSLLAATNSVREPCREVARALGPSLAGAGIKLDLIEELPEDATNVRVLTEPEQRWLVEEAYRLAPREGVRILITRHGLYNCWYSNWYEAQRSALCSLFEWEQLAPLPESAFIAYELLLHGLRGLSPLYAPECFLHDSTRGCLFDFCREKSEIRYKLRSGHICPPCQETLREIGLSVEPLLAIFGCVPQLVLGR